jgi:hypothetical protein
MHLKRSADEEPHGSAVFGVRDAEKKKLEFLSGKAFQAGHVSRAV